MPLKSEDRAEYQRKYRERKRMAKEAGTIETFTVHPGAPVNLPDFDPEAARGFATISKEAVPLTGTAFQLDRALARIDELEQEVRQLKRKLAERPEPEPIQKSFVNAGAADLGQIFRERLPDPDDHFNSRGSAAVPKVPEKKVTRAR